MIIAFLVSLFLILITPCSSSPSSSSSSSPDTPYSLYQLRHGISDSPQFVRLHSFTTSSFSSFSSSSSPSCPSSLSIQLQSSNDSLIRSIALRHSDVAKPLRLSSSRTLCFYAAKDLVNDLIALNIEIENSQIQSMDGMIELSNNVYVVTDYHRHPHKSALSLPHIQSMDSSSSSSLYVLEKIDRPPMINKNTVAKCTVAPSSNAPEPSSSSYTTNKFFLQDDTPRYLELVLVHDRRRLSQYSSEDAALISGSKIAHLTDSLFSSNELDPPLRVILMRQITPKNAVDDWGIPALSKEDGGALVDSLLSKFQRYAANTAPITQYDIRVLLSGYDFERGVIGYAPVGQICDKSNSGAIVQTAYFNDVLAASTVTHEIGHVISMVHDEAAQEPCSKEGNYIMAPYATRTPSQRFSSCSKSQWTTFFNKFRPKCVENEPDPSKIWSMGSCGDGIVTGEEECDCGSANNKTNCLNDPCCDPTSCKLVDGAVCSAAQPCCTQSCTPVSRSANKVCRFSRDSQCDAEERCDGVNADCPLDLVAASGKTCQDVFYNTGSGYCFNGACHTPDKQCKLLAIENKYPVNGWRACAANTAKFCSAIFCTNDTRKCTTPFGIDHSNDGTPCGSSAQCKNGQCVSSQELDITGSYPTTPANPDGFIGSIDYNYKTIIALSIVGSVVGIFAAAAFLRWKKRRDLIAEHQRNRTAPPTVAINIPPNAAISDFARAAYEEAGVNIPVAATTPAASSARSQSATERENDARRTSAAVPTPYLGTIAMPEGVPLNNEAAGEGGNSVRNSVRNSLRNSVRNSVRNSARSGSIALNDVAIAAVIEAEPGNENVNENVIENADNGEFKEYKTSKGIPYWFNSSTGVTSWSDPAKGPIQTERPADA